MSYDTMVIEVALIASRLNSKELEAVVEEYNVTTARHKLHKCGWTRSKMVDARIALRDAYDEYRR